MVSCGAMGGPIGRVACSTTSCGHDEGVRRLSQQFLLRRGVCCCYGGGDDGHCRGPARVQGRSRDGTSVLGVDGVGWSIGNDCQASELGVNGRGVFCCLVDNDWGRASCGDGGERFVLRGRGSIYFVAPVCYGDDCCLEF